MGGQEDPTCETDTCRWVVKTVVFQLEVFTTGAHPTKKNYSTNTKSELV